MALGDAPVGGFATARVPHWYVPPVAGVWDWELMHDCGRDTDGLLENVATSCGHTVVSDDAVLPTTEPWKVDEFTVDEVLHYRWRVNWYKRSLIERPDAALTVVNPGAEDADVSMWTLVSGDDFGQVIFTGPTTAHEGEHAYYLFDDATAGVNGLVYQAITIPAEYHADIDSGIGIVLLAWHQSSPNPAVPLGYWINGEIEFFDGVGTSLGLATSPQISPPEIPAWELAQLPSVVPSGARSLRIYFRVGWPEDTADAPTYLMFDAATLTLRRSGYEFTIQQVWELTAGATAGQPPDYPRRLGYGIIP